MANTVTWQWQERSWNNYEQINCLELEAAYLHYLSNVTQADYYLCQGQFQWMPQSYRVNFRAMTQTNTHTGFARHIRRDPNVPPPAAAGAFSSFLPQQQPTHTHLQHAHPPFSGTHPPISAPFVFGNTSTSAQPAAPVVPQAHAQTRATHPAAAVAQVPAEWLGPPITEPNKDDCAICCDEIGTTATTGAIAFKECVSHPFHAACILPLLKHNCISCPMCKRKYGTYTGNQPDGTMIITQLNQSCGGYPGTRTWQIYYYIPSGIQGPSHPNPGQPYHGTKRVAYVPETPEGTEVVQLLKIAFDRKLIFTVGTSLTTGNKNTVIWNGIHHKTNMSGTSFGYPDPGYFGRVKEELADKGVTPKSIVRS